MQPRPLEAYSTSNSREPGIYPRSMPAGPLTRCRASGPP